MDIHESQSTTIIDQVDLDLHMLTLATATPGYLRTKCDADQPSLRHSDYGLWPRLYGRLPVKASTMISEAG
ncbi:unnamed protein product [Fusarium graminearum]|nr:unnamed protein product [Fusarium graminearum]